VTGRISTHVSPTHGAASAGKVEKFPG